MSTDIQKFDMAAVQQRVSDTIKAQFAMMIPDEAFDAMAQAAITEFFHTEKSFEFMDIRRPNTNSSYYNDQHLKYVLAHTVTPFKAMLWEEVRTIVKEKMNKWIKEEKAGVADQIEKLYLEDKAAHAVFNLNVNQLAITMARNAHLEILNQAAANAGIQLSTVAGSVDVLQHRIQNGG